MLNNLYDNYLTPTFGEIYTDVDLKQLITEVVNNFDLGTELTRSILSEQNLDIIITGLFGKYAMRHINNDFVEQWKMKFKYRMYALLRPLIYDFTQKLKLKFYNFELPTEELFKIYSQGDKMINNSANNNGGIPTNDTDTELPYIDNQGVSKTYYSFDKIISIIDNMYFDLWKSLDIELDKFKDMFVRVLFPTGKGYYGYE